MPFGVVAFVLIVVSFVVVGRLVSPRLRLAAWTLIVIGGVVPWASWVGHAHWDRIEWIPLSRTIRPRDIVLNVLLYVPVGVFFVRARPVSAGRRPVLWAAAYGLGLSVLTEATQIFSHGRFPAMTDVVTNTAGAVIGAWASRLRPPRER